MKILNSGIGIIVFGAPVLQIMITILVAIIEAYTLRKYFPSFYISFKKLLIVNFATTLIGLLFILALNLTDSLWYLKFFFTEFLNLRKFSLLYLTLISVVIMIPNYCITTFMEFHILKIIWKENIAFKDIAKANGISYMLLFLLWIGLLIIVQGN